MVTLPALYQDLTPDHCPGCGGPHVGAVRNEDVEAGVPPERAAQPYPGVLECRGCGVVVQWERSLA